MAGDNGFCPLAVIRSPTISSVPVKDNSKQCFRIVLHNSKRWFRIALARLETVALLKRSSDAPRCTPLILAVT
jgi:hypothetical protein